ncbi:MAG: alkaline phosphatase [Bradymonadaceae bacterium]|nr:alkaline phosphatase [Lujinxingiaceae bacterium]
MRVSDWYGLPAGSPLRFVVLSVLLLSGGIISGCSRPQPATEAAPAVVQETPGRVEAPTAQTTEAPKRIILFIGDGMGVGAITAATYAKGEPLHMLGMPHVGFNTTHEHEFVVADSAASATALATGHKTHFEAVSVKPGTLKSQEEDSANHLETIVQTAHAAGWRTGLVATSRINHATPAAFAAHRSNRNDYEDIAHDMSLSQIDVMLGAGSKFFEKRSDGRDLFAAMGERGYTVARSAEDVQLARKQKARKLVGLMHDSDMPSAQSGERAMSLSQMTTTAIELLDNDNSEGFFLMVEGSQIDWFGHDLDGVGVVAETLDMDEAVGAALAYARTRDDTLVVVTADHETGGMSVLDPEYMSRYLLVLGGQGAAEKSVALASHPDAKSRPSPSPAQHITLGSLNVGESTREGAMGAQFAFGPQELKDRRLTTDFGYLSVASRPHWQQAGAFSASHTAVMVPVFAQGPAAASVASVIDNADLGARLIELVQWHGRADRQPIEAGIVGGVERPQNVIVLIGDGLGLSSLTAALYVRGHLEMLAMPVKGLVATHGTDRVVNDSAATATALATGRRTRSGVVGMAPIDGELRSVETVLERAGARGLRTGLVTTTTLTHATPASFYAHHPDRKAEKAIAEFYMDMPQRISGYGGIDVAIAGGSEIFGEKRLAQLRERGVHVALEWSGEPLATDAPTLHLLAAGGLPAAAQRHGVQASVPSLARMTDAAITSLSARQQGFFLMVEGGQIDWALHGLNRGQELIDEIVDFDEAVAAALEFARKDGNTLVIVTSDHDHTISVLDNHYIFSEGHCGAAKQCGGHYEMAVLPVATSKLHRNEGLNDLKLQGDFGPPGLLLQYSWAVLAANERVRMAGPHAANFVPLFAYGPWAARFGGFHDQPDVGKLLMEWASSAP